MNLFTRSRTNHPTPAIVIQGVTVVLTHEETTTMAVSILVGQHLPLSLAFLDQHGNPIAATPDQPPAWSNTTPTTEGLSVAAGGMSATTDAIAAGSDTVDVTVVVGGKSFSASLAVTVSPQPLVLTTIQIVAGTPA